MDYSYNPTDEQFQQWYENTTYSIFKPQISFRIGVHSKVLDKLLLLMAQEQFIFITAWNPAPIVLSKAENQKRQAALKNQLLALGYQILDGTGVGDDNGWEAEDSLFVAGMNKTNGIKIAKEFGQKAIVYAELGKPPVLVFC